MRRRTFAAAAGAAALAACNRSKQRRIAVIPKSTAHLFWVSVHAGAVAAGQAAGVEILWNGAPTETDFNRQIQIIDSMVAQRVDGIAVAVSERQALVGAVDRAMAAGIPVTVFDSGLDSENYTSWVGTDNVLAGRLAARKMAELLDGKGKVALVLHRPGSLSTMDRETGFKDEMSRSFPGVQVVAEQFGMGDPARARAAAENILAANDGLAGIFTSTEPAATGVTQALRGRQLAGQVKVVTVDASDSLVEDLRGGTVHAIVAQDPFGMGLQAVRTLVEKLNGGSPKKRYDLEPRVVVAFNLDKPEVQRLLKPEINKYL